MKFNARIGDIAEVVMGQSPQAEDVNKIGDGVPLLNGPTEFTSRSPVPVQYTTAGKKFAKNGDILFCVRGSTTGRMNYADQRFAVGRGIAAIRGKNGYPTEYVRAVIERNLERLLSAATGSTFPNIGRDQLCDFEVETVSPEDAIKVNSLIVSLEGKIELNRQINQTLEQMAQAIFKSWFVDFDPVHAKVLAIKEGRDPIEAAVRVIGNPALEQVGASLREIPELFPSEFVESELGLIPKGWEVEELQKICTSVSRGITPKYQEGSGFFAINQKVNKGFELDLSALKELDTRVSVSPEKMAHKYDILINSLGEGTIGRVHYYHLGNGDMAVDQHMSIVRAKTEGIAAYIYHYLGSPEGESRLLSMKTGSTNMTMLNISKIRTLKVPLPNNELLEAFGRDTNLMFEKISHNQRVNFSLVQLRDTLLPKLLSGEIRVGDAEQLCN